MRPDYAFTEIERGEAVARGLALAKAGGAWHFHSLAPGCRFSHRPEHYCFLLEDTDAGRCWCVFSASDFKAECQRLVRVLHGTAILDASARPATLEEPEILGTIRALSARGEAWHHHMMKPGCVLSPSPGQHVITLERASSEEIATYACQSPPNDVLREIELLYFAKR